MLQITDLFFAFLRDALWQSKEDLPKELTEEETSWLFKVAGEQTVMGLIGDVLIRHGLSIPRRFVSRMLWVIEHIQQTNRQVNEELGMLVRLPLTNYAVVKGQTIASFYPSPLLRMPGDIDFLVRDYPIACAILRQYWQVELPERLIDKEIAFKYHGVTYEIHTELLRFGCCWHQRYWKKLMLRDFSFVNVDRAIVPTLESTVYIVYVFCHLFFHFIREGVGIRQMCDWAVMLHHYRNDIDQDELKTILKRLGMLKAYRVFGCILVDKLGLMEFPITIEDNDYKWTDKILADIFKGGNFGHYARERKLKGWSYKMETMKLTFQKCVRYWSLAPAELTMTIPKLVWLNVRLQLNK